jgi:hypothetical protein
MYKLKKVQLIDELLDQALRNIQFLIDNNALTVILEEKGERGSRTCRQSTFDGSGKAKGPRD